MVGSTVAQYDILEQLGSGGMGIVYKATDTKLGRTVALKFLPASVSFDKVAKERFIHEARAASSLDDPHICTIHDIAETEDGRLFIVMAYYEGQTLKYLIDDEPPSVSEACGIIRQVAKGLTAAHDAGIVHRDIKPANIMLTDKGLVKVLDFGVAKLSGGADLTQAGSTIGTAGYMSPEQVRGEAVDARSDIWSLGVILYELLSRTRPFTGGYEAAVSYSILNEAPTPLSGDVPGGLNDVVERCLAKEPSDRYASTKELAQALMPFADPTLVQTVERPAIQQAQTGQAAAPADHALQQAAIRFSIFAAVGLVLVYGIMLTFGLPDWVFPVGVALMLAGLPIVLYSASIERKRAALNSGERARLQGLKAWLTTKRAFQGGFIAMAALALVAVAFLGLRSAGVGPFATLISDGTLSRQDVLIVAHFENKTSDSSLSTTVTEALRIDLSQSGAFRLMDGSTIQAALQRMERDPESELTLELAQDVAQREGVKAIITGDINQAGAGYILNTRILSASDGSQLAAFRENARSDADVLDAIDRSSARLREEIGESISDIRADKPLEQVTTSNTEALRLYTEAEIVSDRGRYGEGLELMKRVVALDPEFGMAYRKMAVLNQNTGGLVDSTRAWVTKGYALRDRLPLRERLLTEAYYYASVENDEEKEAAAYEELLRRYPFDRAALNNLAIYYNDESRFEEAESLLRKALSVEDGSTFRQNLIISLAGQLRFDEVKEEVINFDRTFPGQSRVAQQHLLLAYLDDDFDAAYAWADSMKARTRFTSDEFTYVNRMDDLLMAQGRIREAGSFREQLNAFAERNWDRSDPARVAAFKQAQRVDRLWEVSWLTGDTRELIAAADSLVALDAAATWDADRWGPIGLVAASLGTLGEYEKALEALETFEARVESFGEEIPANARTGSAYIRGMLGHMDTDVAIAELMDVREEFRCLGCFGNYMGDLEAKRGNIEAAARHYAEFVHSRGYNAISFDEGAVAVGMFRLGSLYEETGQLDEAIEAYTKFTKRWAQADPVLLTQVAEARRRIDTLLDRKARERS